MTTSSLTSLPRWFCDGEVPPPCRPAPEPAARNRCQLSGSVQSRCLPRCQDEGPKLVLSRASGLLLVIQGQSHSQDLARGPHLSLRSIGSSISGAHGDSPVAPLHESS